MKVVITGRAGRRAYGNRIASIVDDYRQCARRAAGGAPRLAIYHLAGTAVRRAAIRLTPALML